MSENPWQQRNQIGKSSEETRAGKYIKIGFFICCVSDTHLESRMNVQIPDTPFLNVFQDEILAILSHTILYRIKGKNCTVSSKKSKTFYLNNIPKSDRGKKNKDNQIIDSLLQQIHFVIIAMFTGKNLLIYVYLIMHQSKCQSS